MPVIEWKEELCAHGEERIANHTTEVGSRVSVRDWVAVAILVARPLRCVTLHPFCITVWRLNVFVIGDCVLTEGATKQGEVSVLLDCS